MSQDRHPGSRPTRYLTSSLLIGLFLLFVIDCRTSSRHARRDIDIFELLNLTKTEVAAIYGAHPNACGCYTDRATYAVFCLDEDDEQERMWRVTVSALECDGAVLARTGFANLRTPGGVRLRDTEQAVFDREGDVFERITPSDLRRKPEGPLTADRLHELGDAEYQFATRGQAVLSVFVRNGRVSAISAWISESE